MGNLDGKELVFKDIFWRTKKNCYNARSTISARFEPNSREGEIEAADAYEMKWKSDWFCTEEVLADYEKQYMKNNSQKFSYEKQI